MLNPAFVIVAKDLDVTVEDYLSKNIAKLLT